MLKLELAINMMLPMPALPATISAITEPTNARVTAIFSDARRTAANAGCDLDRHVPPRSAERPHHLQQLGFDVAKAVAILATIGKNDSMKAVMTAGTVPAPNQITKTGTKAAFGTLLKPTSNG